MRQQEGDSRKDEAAASAVEVEPGAVGVLARVLLLDLDLDLGLGVRLPILVIAFGLPLLSRLKGSDFLIES